MFEILNWDTKLFGFNVAKTSLTVFNSTQFEQLFSALKKAKIKLLYAHCFPDDITSQKVAKQFNGILADDKIIYRLSLDDVKPERFDNIITYRGDITLPLERMAHSIGKQSRFYLDENMPREIYKKVYSAWMQNALKREYADEVFVLQENGDPAALIVVKEKNGVGDISLLAVDDAYRGKGYAQQLISHAFSYFIGRGFTHAQVVTQTTNQPACHLYQRCGFSSYERQCFYHFWV
ncbi:MAG: GNAT family N-acetyltransferase [Gammaproteobacteria bacterium]